MYTPLHPQEVASMRPPHQVYRLQEVLGIVKVGRSTLYLWISEGKFPKQRKLGARAVGWMSNDVFEWLSEREAA